MPSTYSPDLRIELMANGEKSGTWGSITNSNLGTILEDAVAGLANVSLISTSQALTVLDGVADESRNAAVRVTSSLSAALSVFVPPVTKLYTFINATNVGGPGTTVTVYASTVAGNTTAAGTGVAVPAGASVLLRCDNTNVVEQLNAIVGNLTVYGSLNTSGSPSFNGNLTVSNSAFLGNSQVASISVANPSVITVAASPVTNAAVIFTTTGTLPTGLTAGTLYYVSSINSTTFNVSTSSTLSPLVQVTAAGAGVHTVSTVSLTVTPPQTSNSTQLATTSYVRTAVTNIPVTLTNWSLNETNAAQTATMTIATPAVVTVTTAPSNGTAVAFTTTGALPTGVTAGTPYYVFNRTSSTYNLATTLGQAQTATFAAATVSTFTVTASPTNGQVVYFSAGCPSAITAGTNYFVVNRTATTFQVSTTAGGSAIAFTGSGSCTATWQSIVATTGTQSGVHTENTSKLYFLYKSVNKMSIDLGGNTIASGNVTAFGTP
jgi:hypothetical protein